MPVQSGNLADSAPRWPAFTAAAQAAGFIAVQALPMRLREERLGALNLLNATPGPLDSDTVALGQASLTPPRSGSCTSAPSPGRRSIAEQLQAALTSRIVIEQAKGFLAERMGGTVEEAFTLLRRYARDHNRRLTEVAAEVVEGGLEIA